MSIIDKIKRKLKIHNKPDISEELVAILKHLTSIDDTIIDLLGEYYWEYDFIIEYGYNQRLSVNKNVVLCIQGEYLEYYSLKEDYTAPETIPLGVIHLPSITAIKRREGS